MLNLLFLTSSTTSESVEPSVSGSEAPISLEEIISIIVNWCMTKGVKLLIGVIVLFILFAIINSLTKGIKKRMLKKHRDETMTNVIFKVSRIVLKAVVFFLFLGYVGIDTAGIGSIIASCAVAIGLALQGSLANIAGWCIIIFMRPFKLGDYVSCQGVDGTVEDIRLFYTNLRTPDNKVIMVPNGALANGNITNFSVKETRRLDHVFQISYADDVNKACALIEQVIAKHPEVLLDPQPFVKMSQCDASSINITSRVWVKQEHYWDLHFALIQEVKEAFDANNITVPYNQIDVHVINEK